jgi:predicted metalloprotease with PDZ domain
LPKPGFEEIRGFRDAVEAVTSEVEPQRADYGDFFERYVSGTHEIPWNDYFVHAGLTLELKKGQAEPSIGIATGKSLPSTVPGAPPTPLPEGQLAITNIRPDSAALAAGLDVGDILVAMNGERVNPDSFNRRWAEQRAGTDVTFTVLRRDQLKTFVVKVGEEAPVTYTIKDRPDAGDAEKQLLSDWLKPE